MSDLSFSSWQIELTTRCPLRCAMCIKETYRDWHRKDMAVGDFAKILPDLKYVRSVVLEGWGESLMHPDILKIIRLVKGQGPEVGFVTSGFGLNRDFIKELIDSGIDFIGFSLSGGTAETHNSIRVNSDFDELLNSIRIFKDITTKNNLKKPRMHIVYLMLRKNIKEMPLVVKLSGEIGIPEVVFINIIHVTNKWQDSEKIFLCSGDADKTYSDIIKETERTAKRYKVKINKPGIVGGEAAVCSENPLENLYISVDGEVSPCVYLHPPIDRRFKRIFCGNEHNIEKVSFGNIFSETIEDIWNKREYEQFRQDFIARRIKLKEAYQSLMELKKLEDTTMPEPPEPCKTCHKILGV